MGKYHIILRYNESFILNKSNINKIYNVYVNNDKLFGKNNFVLLRQKINTNIDDKKDKISTYFYDKLQIKNDNTLTFAYDKNDINNDLDNNDIVNILESEFIIKYNRNDEKLHNDDDIHILTIYKCKDIKNFNISLKTFMNNNNNISSFIVHVCHKLYSQQIAIKSFDHIEQNIHLIQKMH